MRRGKWMSVVVTTASAMSIIRDKGLTGSQPMPGIFSRCSSAGKPTRILVRSTF